LPEPNLLTLCGTAFLAVFVLLALLALVIRLITWFFPERAAMDDAALVAAISAAMATVVPGGRVTRIEEVP
jgi:hypothetical protein